MEPARSEQYHPATPGAPAGAGSAAVEINAGSPYRDIPGNPVVFRKPLGPKLNTEKRNLLQKVLLEARTPEAEEVLSELQLKMEDPHLMEHLQAALKANQLHPNHTQIELKAFPAVAQPILQSFDVDGDGFVDVKELSAAAQSLKASRERYSALLRIAMVGALCMLVLLAGVGVLVGFLLEASKDMSVTGSEITAKGTTDLLVTDAPAAYAFLRDLPNLSLDLIDKLDDVHFTTFDGNMHSYKRAGVRVNQHGERSVEVFFTVTGLSLRVAGDGSELSFVDKTVPGETTMLQVLSPNATHLSSGRVLLQEAGTTFGSARCGSGAPCLHTRDELHLVHRHAWQLHRQHRRRLLQDSGGDDTTGAEDDTGGDDTTGAGFAVFGASVNSDEGETTIAEEASGVQELLSDEGYDPAAATSLLESCASVLEDLAPDLEAFYRGRKAAVYALRSFAQDLAQYPWDLHAAGTGTLVALGDVALTRETGSLHLPGRITVSESLQASFGSVLGSDEWNNKLETHQSLLSDHAPISDRVSHALASITEFHTMAALCSAGRNIDGVSACPEGGEGKFSTDTLSTLNYRSGTKLTTVLPLFRHMVELVVGDGTDLATACPEGCGLPAMVALLGTGRADLLAGTVHGWLGQAARAGVEMEPLRNESSIMDRVGVSVREMLRDQGDLDHVKFGTWQSVRLLEDLDTLRPYSLGRRVRGVADRLELELDYLTLVLKLVVGDTVVPGVADASNRQAYLEQLSTVPEFDDTCECSRVTIDGFRTVAGCVVTEAPALAGLACRCHLEADRCEAEVVRCADPSSEFCGGGTTVQHCVQGGGDCAGYADAGTPEDHCQCDYNSAQDSCFLTAEAPAQTACKCVRALSSTGAMACVGLAAPCSNPKHPKCAAPDLTPASCVLAVGSECNGLINSVCACDVSDGGCVVSDPAPAGTACRCSGESCAADLVGCLDPTSEACRSGSDTSIAACFEAPGGRCDGYGCNCEYDADNAGCRVQVGFEAPNGAACKCENHGASCTGQTTMCRFPGLESCERPSSDIHSCLQGGDDCRGYEEATCNCERQNGGCRVETPAPSGLACRCEDHGSYCSGHVASCANPGGSACMAAGVDLGACLEGAGNCDGYASRCDCDYSSRFDGCYISRLPSPGLACRCQRDGDTCSGHVTRCVNPLDAKCQRPAETIETCHFGGGDCAAEHPRVFGEQCAATGDCIGGLQCAVFGNSGMHKCCERMPQTNQCRQVIEDGDSCLYDETCESGVCDAGACFAKLDAGQLCAKNRHCVTGSCGRVGRSGESECCPGPSYYGENGEYYCTAVVEDRGACEYDRSCSSGYCRAGECFELRLALEACSSDSMCRSGVCGRVGDAGVDDESGGPGGV